MLCCLFCWCRIGKMIVIVCRLSRIVSGLSVILLILSILFVKWFCCVW